MLFKMYTEVDGWKIEFRYDRRSKRPSIRVINIANPRTWYSMSNAVIMARDLLPVMFWPEFAKILIDEQESKNPPNQESLI